MSKYNSIFVSGRYVGRVDGDTFKKNIKGSKHILHAPPAIALSVESLAQAEQAGAREIEVTDTESERVYCASVEHFRRYAFPLQRGGFEPQRALTLDRWTVTGGNVTTTRAAEVMPARPAVQQLSLFNIFNN
jgi:hypothetical protein